MDLRDSRELALQRLAKFCRSGFFSVTDFKHDPLKIFAAHEVAAMVDPSMATKATVQFNLFGACCNLPCCCSPWELIHPQHTTHSQLTFHNASTAVMASAVGMLLLGCPNRNTLPFFISAPRLSVTAGHGTVFVFRPDLC